MNMRELDLNLNQILKYMDFGGEPRVFFRMSKYYLECLIDELERTLKSPMNNENLLNTYLAIRHNPAKQRDPYVAKLPNGAGDDFTKFYISLSSKMPLEDIELFVNILKQVQDEDIIFKEADEYSNESLLPIIKKSTAEVILEPTSARMLFRMGVLDEFIDFDKKQARGKDFKYDSVRNEDKYIVSTVTTRVPKLDEIINKKAVEVPVSMDGSGINFKFA